MRVILTIIITHLSFVIMITHLSPVKNEVFSENVALVFTNIYYTYSDSVGPERQLKSVKIRFWIRFLKKQ